MEIKIVGETRGTPFSSFGDSFVYIMRNKEGEGKEKQRKKKIVAKFGDKIGGTYRASIRT